MTSNVMERILHSENVGPVIRAATVADCKDNSFYSFATSFVARLGREVNARRAYLTQLVNDPKYAYLFDHAARFSGRRPNWHIETGLVKRFIKAGFGEFIVDFPRIEPHEFEEQLNKGESLMKQEVGFTGDKRKLIAAAKRVSDACLFPEEKFMPVSLEFAAENQLNHRSSAAFPHFVRKGKVLPELIAEAKLAQDNPRSLYWFWPGVRGFRLQLRESFGELSRKIRLMYPIPGWLILLEDTFIMPFVAHFINTETFYVIGRSGRGIGDLLRRKLSAKSNQPICSLDVSAYDQSIVNEALIAAFAIIRAQLKLTKVQAIAFENIVKYFCTNIMVSKGPNKQANVFVRHHGIPSGSGFTNMIGTLAHAIVLEYCEPGILEKEGTLICGDDNIFRSENLDVNRIFNGYKTFFNLTVDPVKTEFFENALDIKFLGFRWIKFIRHISLNLAINQCIWHTDFFVELSQFDREVARCASVLLNGRNGANVFRRVFPEVVRSLDMGIDITYTYLTGYMPPTASSSLTYGNVTSKPGINQSLSLHLAQGYLIR